MKVFDSIVVLSSVIALSGLPAFAGTSKDVAPSNVNSVITSVNDLGRITHSLKRSLSGIAHEVDRIEESDSDPDILNQAFLDDKFFTPTAPGQQGMLPARKEWLDLYLFQIEKLVSLMQTEVNNIAAQIGGESTFDV